MGDGTYRQTQKVRQNTTVFWRFVSDVAGGGGGGGGATRTSTFLVNALFPAISAV